ncbi:MAG: hypothetical protein ACTSO8_05275 [Promethearchaeota archaeon]
MDILNLIKIIATIITAVIALIIGIRVFSLNKSDLLNRWFALFFISSSLGFTIYTIYHLILNNADIIIPLMITAQILFNFNLISLTMTLFVLEKHTRIAMGMKYFGTMLIVFFVMSIGYFIFHPHLQMDAYAIGIVDTHTPPELLIFVNAIRLLLAIYVAYRYLGIAKKIESETKNRIKWFSVGVIVIILGLIFNLAGGLLLSIVMEIVALIIIDIGAFLILKGFLP